MKKKAHKTEFEDASYNTGGLFGSSTTTKEGTTYNPTNRISNIANTSLKNWNKSLNQLNNFDLNRDFSKDKNYQVYSNNLENQMRSDFNNNVLNPIANNGLMRTSGLQAATNAFNDTLANRRADLYDRYYNRLLDNYNILSNKLSNYENSANNIYNYISGANAGSLNNANFVNAQALGDYNKQLAEAQANSQLWQNIAGTVGTAVGSYFGGAAGGAAGNAVGRGVAKAAT